ncbi:DsbE family thiol:disulfide interchange protein [Aureimonas leprariae]|uniref:DsbE family thiol:disulfide interchange protein n=1 Tax=Plantimonas leprariae TaxID=2615207 RepID=A0A7V7U0W5_9HYPH|nr:DsbE family thiol:disulfide interchange protein [Aureimonas leprariae]KAB0681197.1 DsbE family thiol:disulfide interchange protein [Aureimonas leprariae]
MSADAETGPRRRFPVLVLLPLLAFLGLASVFLVQLGSGRDPATVPSALIGAPAPRTVLPALEGAGRPGLDLSAPPDKPTLVNVFASWCGPCREEHPILTELAKDPRFRLVAINHKDKPEAALGFLRQLGNPYAAIGTDAAGRATIDWGVYGVPETFLVGTDGRILWKQTGPFTPEAVRNGLYPALEKALAGKASP